MPIHRLDLGKDLIQYINVAADNSARFARLCSGIGTGCFNRLINYGLRLLRACCCFLIVCLRISFRHCFACRFLIFVTLVRGFDLAIVLLHLFDLSSVGSIIAAATVGRDRDEGYNVR